MTVHPEAVGEPVHEVNYLHVRSGDALPDWAGRRPFHAVVVATCAVADAWQSDVSDWLVKSGCLYMMAWGVDCSGWDDSVDYAVSKMRIPGGIPDEQIIMTTWHERDTLEYVFWYAQYYAQPGADDKVLGGTLILDIGEEAREDELRALFASAIDFDEREP